MGSLKRSVEGEAAAWRLPLETGLIRRNQTSKFAAVKLKQLAQNR